MAKRHRSPRERKWRVRELRMETQIESPVSKETRYQERMSKRRERDAAGPEKSLPEELRRGFMDQNRKGKKETTIAGSSKGRLALAVGKRK